MKILFFLLLVIFPSKGSPKVPGFLKLFNNHIKALPENDEKGLKIDFLGVVKGNFSGLAISYIGTNITKDASGVMFGMVNKVDGNFAGFQASNYLNYVGKEMKGVQLALAANYVGGSSKGLQLSIGGNIAKREYSGLQGSALFNYAGKLYGAQIAGLFNYAGGKSGGVQCGLINYAYNFRGFQVGFINIAKYSFNYDGMIFDNIINKTAQMGALNISTNNIGQQEGYINIANRVNFQYGVINFALDSVYFQIGAINISNKLNGLAIGAINVSWKNGGVGPVSWYDTITKSQTGIKFRANHIYSIVAVGSEKVPGALSSTDTSGYYFGVHFKLYKNLFFEADIGGVYKKSFKYSEEPVEYENRIRSCQIRHRVYATDYYFQSRAKLGWQVHKRFSIFGGISKTHSNETDISFFGGFSIGL